MGALFIFSAIPNKIRWSDTSFILTMTGWGPHIHTFYLVIWLLRLSFLFFATFQACVYTVCVHTHSPFIPQSSPFIPKLKDVGMKLRRCRMSRSSVPTGEMTTWMQNLLKLLLVLSAVSLMCGHEAWLAVSELIHPKGVLWGCDQVLPHKAPSSVSSGTLLCALVRTSVETGRRHPQTAPTDFGDVKLAKIKLVRWSI